MRPKAKIRVLVVDDSILFRETLVRGIAGDSAIEVVGTAEDAFSARRELERLHPDVMTLDIEMPRMSGVDFLHQCMREHPLPVVVVSSASEALFDALGAGAVDFVAKPDTGRPGGVQSFLQQMCTKIKIASTARVGQMKRAVPDSGKHRGRLIAIGASTGGTEATLEVLRDLPADTPGIVVVQHMPPVFTRMYAERLNNICRMQVAEAKNGDSVVTGRVLIAPGGKQMRLVREGAGFAVRVQDGEKVNGHAPSVDVLFHSVADTAGAQAVGVILTGMGGDGAKGLLHMRESGAHTVGQDEKTCVVYGMPMVAYQIGAVEKQLPLAAVSGELLRLL